MSPHSLSRNSIMWWCIESESYANSLKQAESCWVFFFFCGFPRPLILCSSPRGLGTGSCCWWRVGTCLDLLCCCNTEGRESDWERRRSWWSSLVWSDLHPEGALQPPGQRAVARGGGEGGRRSAAAARWAHMGTCHDITIPAEQRPSFLLSVSLFFFLIQDLRSVKDSDLNGKQNIFKSFHARMAPL